MSPIFGRSGTARGGTVTSPVDSPVGDVPAGAAGPAPVTTAASAGPAGAGSPSPDGDADGSELVWSDPA